MTANLSVLLAFGAGLLSFVSPCCLPLYPSFLSYVTGITMDEVKKGRAVFQRQALLHTLFFILGFSIVFVALGLSTSWLGNLFAEKKDLIRQLGGILLAVIGLVLLGVFQMDWMMRTWKIDLKSRPLGYTGSILVGITYAAGWTPCVGPILSGIFVLGVTDPTRALTYTLAYTLGFALPFFLMTFFISKVGAIVKYSDRLMKLGGAAMILFGILLYTDKLTEITRVLIQLYGGFTGF
ncbi:MULTISPECIES: cytochrome c biogenesis CcdA family protein [Bacillales]|jgi:cytochrome c-type biogenesis protein|uniref:Cytochrome C biogenesis protein CcdA n=1 Tax=Brevibacillus aydinogluensis TaxID=927786 RepID=A0AA48M7F7_9BACL|nr:MULTISPECIES: cytochrome c biogenesis protein CcdA [Bacillales]REK65879.1 MAG: cytochrome C biogenesis protein CcdA [Brevibacillus sp.]MBR8659583.1 sulfite exporter TauE/SafE family protein [Brevibacillus sp. NL20B1]MDT3415616.1 cytochrome c-type biogenesis protein [Brevibacillus aydinogluensis]NNV01922.1 cytochrome c biogenesis protein CcdA [Brevibacillus sp. MCWH]UFJ60647.1 sulfite exporter TauE/SafE family protein [Anoxybacillus sediminis]